MKTMLDSNLLNGRRRYIKNLLNKKHKKPRDVFDKLEDILSKRVTNYTSKLADFKWATNDQIRNFKQQIFKRVSNKYFDTVERNLEKGIDKNEISSFNRFDSIQLCKDLDEILCVVDPRFIELVEYKPGKEIKNSVKETKTSDKENYTSSNNISNLIRWIYKKHKGKIDKEFLILEKETRNNKMFASLWKKVEVFENLIFEEKGRHLKKYERKTVREYMKPSKFKKLAGNKS